MDGQGKGIVLLPCVISSIAAAASNRFPNPHPARFRKPIDDCDDDTETSTLTSWARMKKDAQAKID